MKLTIKPEIEYQTYESIGASGAWWAQIVGGWDHIDTKSGKPVRDRIAELLYNKEIGIGMQNYRYNIGAGSRHSGKGYYSQPARATECFEVEEGIYDWSRDANAVYMLKKAVENGADEIVFFVNSPIERLTKNGMAHADRGAMFKENIAKENYSAFAKYCLDVTEHFINEGIPVKYLSPVNEPIWVWNGGQEGCFYRPKSVGKVFCEFARQLDERKIRGLMLSGAESGDLRWFNKSYTRNLLKYENVRKYLDGVDVHSYFLDSPKPLNFKFLCNREDFQKRFKKFMDKKYPNVKIKMSEWTHMQGGRDYGMDSAIVMATVMYEDFTRLNVTSWQHWIAVSEVDYCDGLIYINLEDKTFEMTKRYYGSGNYSKYIKVGSVRVDAMCDDEDVVITAFKYENEITAVFVNKSETEKIFEITATGDVFVSVTDKDNDLTESVQNEKNVKLNPRSITTVRWNI